MVSPVELSKLGARARFQKLGSLKYILIGAVIFLVIAGMEMVRYKEYERCIMIKTDEINRNIERHLGSLQETIIERARLYEQKSNDIYINKIDKKLDEQMFQFEQKTQTTIADINKIEQEISITKERCKSSYRYDIFGWFSWASPIGVAHAQIKIGSYSESDIRGIVIVSIFASMGLFFFLSTGALLFSKNAKVVAFAMDSVKTLLGFFIGVAMSFMGVR